MESGYEFAYDLLINEDLDLPKMSQIQSMHFYKKEQLNFHYDHLQTPVCMCHIYLGQLKIRGCHDN